MDKVIYGPDIYTLTSPEDRQQAVGIDGQRIEFVGGVDKALDRANPDAEIIRSDAAVVLPGFVDAHVHFIDLGIYSLHWRDLSGIPSKSELLEQVRDEARAEDPGDWVLGTGWDESNWNGDQSFPTREELDEAVPDHPVAVQRVDMHTICVNTEALNRIDLESTVPDNQLNGVTAGILTERAALAAKNSITYSVQELVEALREAENKAARKGVTSVHQMIGDPGRFPSYFRAYEGLKRSEGLTVRAYVYFTEDYLHEFTKLGVESGFGDDRLRIGGLKLFADGSLGSKTALLNRPYAEEEKERGTAIHEKEELLKLIETASRKGIQVAVHAIGDRAIDRVLGCYSQLTRKTGGFAPLRHRVEHCLLATNKQIRRMKELGLVASLQPNFTGNWGRPGGMYEARLGKDRLKKVNRLRVYQRVGVSTAFGSDGMPFDPLYGVHWAVNGPFSVGRISPYRALKAYTGGGAYAGVAEKQVGTIEPGKYADFVLLDGDPMKNPDEIRDLNVVMTVVGGEVIYQG